VSGNGSEKSSDEYWRAWISTTYLYVDILAIEKEIVASPVTKGIREVLLQAADELAPELNKLRSQLDDRSD
jgi:hypothetical protein